MDENNQAAIEKRLGSLERTTQDTLDTMRGMLAEMRRTNDNFISSVEHLIRENERLQGESKDANQALKELSGRMGGIEVGMARLAILESALLKKNSTASKWGIFAAMMTGILATILVRSLV